MRAAPPCAINAALREALSSPHASKTYYAITRGEGAEQRAKGRFLVDRPIKSAPPHEVKREARTHFTFLAGCDASRPAKYPNTDTFVTQAEFTDGAAPGGWGRASLVRCELETGRWHQIRRHLNGLSRLVLGDAQHGNSHTNREWRGYGLLPELRLALHCSRLSLPPTDLTPAIDVACPLPPDLRALVDALPPSFGKEARRLAPELFLPWPPSVV
jgi:23S rRNA-/tRNA-specific pseudouridylate synthase